MVQKPIIVSLAVTALWGAAGFADGTVPEPFRSYDPDSRFTINYEDVDAILGAMVVDVSGPTRQSVDAAPAPTGTRMKAQVSRSSSTQGNRIYFEQLAESGDYRAALHNIRSSLEAIPGQIALENFTRTEQLAYWLNLHNVTLIEELLRVYPERDLKKELDRRAPILDEKILNVAGVPLSLNDIRHTILPQNYNRNPLVIYGLFEGTLGGPDIRKNAYTGENVQEALEANAREFINSDRGAVRYKSSTFRVSSLYERYADYFPNFEPDLKVHLMNYMGLPERRLIPLAESLKPVMDDWTIADTFERNRRVGGSFSTNRAAMLDAVVSTQADGQGGTAATGFSAAESGSMARAELPATLSLEQLKLLSRLKNEDGAAALVREGRVVIEEPCEAGAESPDAAAGCDEG